jgi:hypothetical protein
VSNTSAYIKFGGDTLATTAKNVTTVTLSRLFLMRLKYNTNGKIIGFIEITQPSLLDEIIDMISAIRALRAEKAIIVTLLRIFLMSKKYNIKGKMKNQHTTKKGTGRVHKNGIKHTDAKHHRSKFSFLAYQYYRNQI